MRYPSTVLYGLRDCSIRGGEVRKLRIYDTLTCIVAREWGGADGTILIFTGVIIEKFCFSTSVESENQCIEKNKRIGKQEFGRNLAAVFKIYFNRNRLDHRCQKLVPTVNRWDQKLRGHLCHWSG
jgi:hypothetical protein